MEYYQTITKDKVMQFSTIWIDLKSSILSENREKERDRYRSLSVV